MRDCADDSTPHGRTRPDTTNKEKVPWEFTGQNCSSVVRAGDVGAAMSLVEHLEEHSQSKTFPMRLVIVDRAARRIAGETSLEQSNFGVGATGSPFNPLHVDDEV